MKSRRNKIDWKKQLKRETFLIKNGRWPHEGELRTKNQPVLMFGYNTVR